MKTGDSLGHFTIQDKLGAGGMGEVYLAQDTRLGRLVAVKILPPELNDDPSRAARFAQESRAASALSHPNIAHIYEGPLGVIIEGAYADLLVVNGNPIEDVTVLRDRDNLMLIMKDGDIYKNALVPASHEHYVPTPRSKLTKGTMMN